MGWPGGAGLWWHTASPNRRQLLLPSLLNLSIPLPGPFMRPPFPFPPPPFYAWSLRMVPRGTPFRHHRGLTRCGLPSDSITSAFRSEDGTQGRWRMPATRTARTVRTRLLPPGKGDARGLGAATLTLRARTLSFSIHSASTSLGVCWQMLPGPGGHR